MKSITLTPILLSLFATVLAAQDLYPDDNGVTTKFENSQEKRFTVVEIGTFGGTSSEAFAINDIGQVIGRAAYPDNKWHAFIWQDGIIKDLGFSESSIHSVAYGINNDGQVVGAQVISEQSVEAFLWENDEIQILEGFGGPFTRAYGINNIGQVVGSSSDGFATFAVLWQNGTPLNLGTFGDQSFAYGINDHGQIVGYVFNEDEDDRAFLWESGSMQDLQTPVGMESVAYAINNAAQVVGDYYDNSTSTGVSFLWDNGHIQDLWTFESESVGAHRAYGINDSGQIVGNAAGVGLGHFAFLWDNGKMYNLNELIASDSGWQLDQARAINNEGWIVGRGRHENRSKAFLLIPEGNIIIVNSTGDFDDYDPDDEKCDTGVVMPDGKPECTLRAAIRHANTLDEPVKIVFDIEQEGNTFIDGNPVIAPVAALPFMLNNITIDATTQPEGSVILSGASAGTHTDGLRADADSITIKGLTISDFDGYGIALLGGSYQTITGNIVGYNADQTELRLNNRGGIYISDDAHHATIGSSDPDDQNIIAGGISFGESIPDGVKILRNRIEVPEEWLSGDELRVLIGKGANGSPACVPWNESSSNKLPAPRIFDLTDEYVAGMTRPGATVIVYHALETGSERGRYFPRIVEPVAMGTANQNGQYHISVNLEPEIMVSVGAVGADGGSSELSQLKRPVIYAPGIGGSWLRGSDDERLWLPLAVSGAEKNNRLARLALDDSGNDMEQIRVDGILELAGHAGYGPALSYLQENGYPGHPDNLNTVDLDLWRFANDWRKNPSDLADSLRSLIDFVLSGSTQVAHSCEVDIISHSNGGVIAAAYVRKHPDHSGSLVNRLITIGTPYLGTPQAAAAHTRGYVFGIEEELYFKAEWGRMVGMTRNLTGAYGLMPSKKYWEATDFGEHSGYLMDLDRNLLSTYDDTFNFITAPKTDVFSLPIGLQRNASLWNSIETNVHGLIDDWREWQGPPFIYRLVGDLPVSTTIGWIWEQFPYPLIYLGHLNIHADEGDLTQHIEYRAMQTAVPGDGDGTVSLTSATLGHHPRVGAVDFSGVDNSPWINPFEYYPCNHMGLIETGCTSADTEIPILDRVLRILRSGYIVEPPADTDNLNMQMNIPSVASNAQENNNVHEVFYITANAPVGVHIYDSEGNHTGPASLTSTAVSDSIVYDIDGIGYWPNALAATVSLDRNQSYNIRIATPVGAGQVRVLRVLMDTNGSNLQVVFPDIELQEGGSIQMQLVEGGLAEDAPFMVDTEGTGTFNDLLEPALTLSSNTPVPSVPSTDRFIYSIKVNPDQVEDQLVAIEFRGDKDAGWEWELSGNSDWVKPDINSGKLDGPPSLTVLSATLPEGTYNDTLKIIVRKDDFERENNIVIRLVKDVSVSVDENDAQPPSAFRLYQNYPNPFNPSTVIEFELPAAANVQLVVYDMLGRRVAVLENGMRTAGRHQVSFDASSLSSGLYIYRITAGEFVQTRKMMLVK